MKVHPLVVRITHRINAFAGHFGFKSPKHITALYVTNEYPRGYWEDQGCHWYSGS